MNIWRGLALVVLIAVLLGIGLLVYLGLPEEERPGEQAFAPGDTATQASRSAATARPSVGAGQGNNGGAATKSQSPGTRPSIVERVTSSGTKLRSYADGGAKPERNGSQTNGNRWSSSKGSATDRLVNRVLAARDKSTRKADVQAQSSSKSLAKPPAKSLSGLQAGATSEAGKFVADIAKLDQDPVEGAKAKRFVSPQQTVALPERQPIEIDTIGQLKLDPRLESDSTVTVVRRVPEVKTVTPTELLAQVGGELEQPVAILTNSGVRKLPAKELLASAAEERADSDATIEVVRERAYFERRTVAELMTQFGNRPDTQIEFIRGDYAPNKVTVAELLEGIVDVSSGSVVYLHAVTTGDSQGVWGIIHNGIIDSFARGIAIRRGENIDRFQVEIPADSDERVARRSSFLGKLIDRKSKESAVYNFKMGRMTRNPDLIFPGNEIVIVNFTPEELMSIYRHFADSNAG